MQETLGQGRDPDGFLARARLAAIVNDSEDAIIGRNLDGLVTNWNRSAENVFGYSAQEMLGQPVKVLLPAHMGQEEAQITERLEQGQKIKHFETVRRHKDGREIEVNVAVSPVRDPEGNLIGVSEIARDITQFNRAQRELVQAKENAEAVSRELESFSYSIAHDLRAPLRSIDGYSQALLEDYQDHLDEDGRRYLGYVRESAQLMAQLIDDMLTLSRITLTDLDSEEVDLSGLARAVAEGFQRVEPNRRIDVRIEEGLVTRGDARMLRVVLENLLSNAWKFTTSRGGDARVEVGAITREGTPTYFIRDNGVGFEMSYAKKLFGIFQRLHSPKDFGGTGVGLAIVERLVRRHGGQVSAEGVVDAGATFFFTLNQSEKPT